VAVLGPADRGKVATTVASGTGDATWGPGLVASGGWGPGDLRRFRAWCRDPGSSPCASQFNLSHGLEVVFQ